MLPPNFYNQGDQAIYSAGDFFIPQERFRAAPYNINTPNNPDEVPAGIPTVYQSQGGGGGGTYTGGISDLTTNFFDTTANRQNRLTELNRPLAEAQFPSFKGARTSDLNGDPYGLPNMKGFSANEMYNKAAAAKAAGLDTTGMFTGNMNADQAMDYADDRIQDHKMRYATGQLGPSFIEAEKPTLNRRINDMFYSLPGLSKPQSADQIIADGYTGQSNMPGILGMMIGKMDKYGSLPTGDQAFIARNMGYTGPTVFGANDSGLSKDVFGMNTRSGFGNYAEAVGKQVDSLGESLSGRLSDKYGATFNAATGMFESEDEEAAAKANKMTKMMRAKFNFYTKQVAQRDADRKAAEEAAAAKAAAAAAASRAESARQYDPNKHGSTNYGLGSDGQQSYSGDSIGAGNLGFGVSATGGGPVSNKTGKGRTGYLSGGLADMLEIYD